MPCNPWTAWPRSLRSADTSGSIKSRSIPDSLRYHDLPLSQVIDAVKASNIDVGAKTVESGGMEFIVRGKGFIGSGKTEPETIEQIENTVVVTRDGVPVRIKDLAQVQIGPAFRRGALDWNGQEAVGGVVVMRYGENPREVIARVKQKIAALESELDGIQIQGIYDRTLLIDETVATLSDALVHETLITIAVMVLFLLHVRASLVIAITLPMAVLDVVHRHEGLRRGCQHHVPGGHCDRHRHDGRYGHHRAGKHLWRSRGLGSRGFARGSQRQTCKSFAKPRAKSCRR